jgi:hypothetical protein
MFINGNPGYWVEEEITDLKLHLLKYDHSFEPSLLTVIIILKA